MLPGLRAMVKLGAALAAEPLLPLTVIGVLAAAFLLKVALDADIGIVAGITVVGCVTAVFLESKARAEKR